MTTLLICEMFPPKTGGSSRWFWEIYRRLPREGFVIAAGENAGQTEFDRTHDLRVVRIPLTFSTWGVGNLTGFRNYWRSLNRLRQLVGIERVESVHCGRCLPEGLLAWMIKQRLRIPYACYAHGEELNTTSTSRELSWLTRRVLRGSEFIIANSRNTERILRDKWGLSTNRIRLLYPGVDTKRFVPAVRNPAVRADLRWGERPVVLTVGRLQKRKGQDQMILALHAIRTAIPDVLYALVGDGEEREPLRQLVEKEGLGQHVQFMGGTDDELLVNCYQQCDLFVLPNREINKDIEGFGMVLLEAQACGKPVVAGNSGGTAETMRSPETGRIVSCYGPNELAAVLIELLKDPDLRAQMGTEARKWVVGHFDWSFLTREAEELFQGAPTDREDD
ncbi:MAG: glycosyltransferase family 4 protein [Deltaproteobacteria bacterium]|nr:glycosyltransferase family 4 protein [Deltaproteobacteria bacterium]